MFEEIFRNKILNEEKLLNFGFNKQGNTYIYTCNILDNFSLTVNITHPNICTTKLIDNDTNSEYSLYLNEANVGNFVGLVRSSIIDILQNIVNKCFDENLFVNKLSYAVIDYIKATFHDDPEILWEKYPNYAVFRRKDSSNWYGIIMEIPYNKLGIESNLLVDIIDVRVNSELLNKIVDNKKFFRGYHMNKSHWLTILLDGSVEMEKIEKYISDSYILADSKRHK